MLLLLKETIRELNTSYHIHILILNRRLFSEIEFFHCSTRKEFSESEKITPSRLKDSRRAMEELLLKVEPSSKTKTRKEELRKKIGKVLIDEDTFYSNDVFKQKLRGEKVDEIFKISEKIIDNDRAYKTSSILISSFIKNEELHDNYHFHQVQILDQKKGLKLFKCFDHLFTILKDEYRLMKNEHERTELQKEVFTESGPGSSIFYKFLSTTPKFLPSPKPDEFIYGEGLIPSGSRRNYKPCYSIQFEYPQIKTAIMINELNRRERQINCLKQDPDLISVLNKFEVVFGIPQNSRILVEHLYGVTVPSKFTRKKFHQKKGDFKVTKNEVKMFFYFIKCLEQGFHIRENLLKKQIPLMTTYNGLIQIKYFTFKDKENYLGTAKVTKNNNKKREDFKRAFKEYTKSFPEI